RIASTPPATTLATASAARSRPRAGPLRAPSIATMTARPSRAKMWCIRRLAQAGPGATSTGDPADRSLVSMFVILHRFVVKPGQKHVVEPPVSKVELIIPFGGRRVRNVRPSHADEPGRRRLQRQDPDRRAAEHRRA